MASNFDILGNKSTNQETPSANSYDSDLEAYMKKRGLTLAGLPTAIERGYQQDNVKKSYLPAMKNLGNADYQKKLINLIKNPENAQKKNIEGILIMLNSRALEQSNAEHEEKPVLTKFARANFKKIFGAIDNDTLENFAGYCMAHDCKKELLDIVNNPSFLPLEAKNTLKSYFFEESYEVKNENFWQKTKTLREAGNKENYFNHIRAVIYNPQNFSGEELKQFLTYFRPDTKTQWFEAVWKPIKKNVAEKFFDALAEHELTENFQRLCANSQAHIKPVVREWFKNWHAIYLEKFKDGAIERVVLKREIAKPGEPEGMAARDRACKTSGSSNQYEFIDRNLLIKTTIKQNLDLLDPANKVRFFDPEELEINATRKFPYGAFQIKTPDALTLIFYSNHIGLATWILRNAPEEIDPEVTKVDFSKHLENPAAFKIIHNNDDQYNNELRNYIFTPLDQLPEQLKTKTSWAHKDDMMIDSYIAHIIHKGERPKTNDNINLIEHGRLAEIEKTTWERAYKAYQRRHKDKKDENNFTFLHTHLLEENPGLDEFLTGKPPIRAKEVFNQVTQIIQEQKIVPQKKNYNDLEENNIRVAGRSFAALNLAFKYHAIKDIAEYVNDNDALPESLDEFVTATGLARREENHLLPGTLG